MKFKAKENQLVIAGRVGRVERKTDGLVSVSIANKKNKEETEWLYVAFTNNQDTSKAQNADLAEKYIGVGQFIVVVADEVTKGEYKNLYAAGFDFGVKAAPKAE